MAPILKFNFPHLSHFQFEKERNDKAVAKLEVECSNLKKEKDQLITEKEAILADQALVKNQHGDWEQKLKEMEKAREDALAEKDRVGALQQLY